MMKPYPSPLIAISRHVVNHQERDQDSEGAGVNEVQPANRLWEDFAEFARFAARRLNFNLEGG
jgi:hypothetical protein